MIVDKSIYYIRNNHLILFVGKKSLQSTSARQINYVLRLQVVMHELKANRNHFSQIEIRAESDTFLLAVVNIRVNYFLLENSFEKACKHVRVRSFAALTELNTKQCMCV